MRYHKKVLPSARAEFARYSQTYGTAFASAARRWRDGIVSAVSAGDDETFVDASVEELLERVLAEDPDDGVADGGADAWEHARQRFGRGVLARARAGRAGVPPLALAALGAAGVPVHLFGAGDQHSAATGPDLEGMLHRELASRLSAEEMAVLYLVTQGQPVDEVAKRMEVSRRTIYRALQAIRASLEASRRDDAG